MTSAAETETATVRVYARPGPFRRVYRRWTSIPMLVRAATGAFAGLAIAMMYLYPVNYGFDEPQHFDMAYAYAQGHGTYDPGGRVLAGGVWLESHNYARGYPPQDLADKPIPPRSARESIAQLGGDKPIRPSLNQMVQHPPGYYFLGAAILAFPGVSSLHYDVQFTLLRFLSLLLLLPIPWLCFAFARRFGAGSLAPAAALFPLLLPSLARAAGSVTNDSLEILCAGVVMYLIAKVLTGDLSRRTGIWMGLWIAIGLYTKVFALILPLLAGAAYLVAWRRHKQSIIAPGLFVVAGSIAGGIWWLHNEIAFGKLQPSGLPAGYTDAKYAKIAQGTDGTFSSFLPQALHHFVGRFWGSIGLIESPDYNWTFATAATVITIGLLVFGLVRGIGGPYGRLSVAVTLVAVPMLLCSMFSTPWHIYHKYKVIPGIQGRYLYPALVAIAGVCIVSLAALLRQRAHRFVAPAIVLAALFAQLWTFRAVVHSWWVSPSRGHFETYKVAVHEMLDWAPWPIGVSAVLLLGTLSATAWLIVAAIRDPLAAEADSESGLAAPLSEATPDPAGSPA